MAAVLSAAEAGLCLLAVAYPLAGPMHNGRGAKYSRVYDSRQMVSPFDAVSG